MKEPALEFLEYCQMLFRKDAQLYKGKDTDDGYPSPSVLVFNDIPDPGYMTCVTYGLSYMKHETWKGKRRMELIQTVNSQDPAWAIELADLVSELRGKNSFSYGTLINQHRNILPGLEMAGYFLFAPIFLQPEHYLDIDIGVDFKICLNGIYPISGDEGMRISQDGLEKFWKDESIDILDVSRKGY